MNTAAAGRPRALTAMGAAMALVAIVALVGGIWARAASGSMWPAVLTDWTLGSCLLCLSATGVGVVVTTRLPRNAVGWLFLSLGALTALVFALRWYTTAVLLGGPATGGAIWAAWGFALAIPVNMTCLALVTVLFPYGTPPSRRWRPAVALIGLIGIAAAASQAVSPYHPDQTPFSDLRNPTALLRAEQGLPLVENASTLLFASLLVAGAGLVVRSRRSRGIERQQVKWFVFAAVVAFSTLFGGFWSDPLFVVATLVALPAVPVAAGIAIMRYRLYDIDRVINRTVVYALVTGILALSYLTVVATLRSLTAGLTGDTALSVAASTLAVAALFRPVRNRIQDAVDRRFNRARYDAAATVEALRAHVRDEVDLDALKVALLGAVCATMQPAATTLWLREAER